MNSHVRRFYCTYTEDEAPIRFFHEVIALHEAPRLSWEEAKEKVPSLPKGWYELALLPSNDRCEFVREFWLSSLPIDARFQSFLHLFFSKVDDIGVYIVQSRFSSQYECEIVYSLEDDTSFFHGFPPALKRNIENLQRDFNDLLPEDYLAFLKVHDGFSRCTDTGFIRTHHMLGVYEKLQERIQNEIIYSGKQMVQPHDLIPFYEFFGEPSFQCFYLNWMPVGAPGNVYYSASEGKISNVHDPSSWNENLAFPTFLGWLMYYLEGLK